MSVAAGEEDYSQRKYKGVRRRKWGKWVSEIRVPGTQERLWLGSYSSPEGAAIAHDIAFYCLRKPSSLNSLNFPSMLPPNVNANICMSPKSIQRAASDAGMAVDAQMIGVVTGNDQNSSMITGEGSPVGKLEAGEALSISVEDYL